MQLRGTDLVVDKVRAKKASVSGLGATRTLNENESGSLITLDRAAGIVVTLPTAKAGITFDVNVSTSVTSNSYKVITASASEFLTGGVTNVDTDTSNAVAFFSGNGTTHVALTMNGTTTGGLIGTALRFTAISSTLWTVEGVNMGSGVVATPFATS